MGKFSTTHHMLMNGRPNVRNLVISFVGVVYGKAP